MYKLVLVVCILAISCNSPKKEPTTISQVPNNTETEKNSPNTPAQTGNVNEPTSPNSEPTNSTNTEPKGTTPVKTKNEMNTTPNVATTGKTNSGTQTTATLPTSNEATNKETIKSNLKNNNNIETKTDTKGDPAKVTKNEFRNAGNTAAPSCIQKLIKEFQGEEKQNPPRKIYSYMYKGSTVYYVTAPCCDFFTDLYDKNCNLMGHPDGGITGRGDGKFTDFIKLRSNEKLIWKDGRK